MVPLDVEKDRRKKLGWARRKLPLGLGLSPALSADAVRVTLLLGEEARGRAEEEDDGEDGGEEPEEERERGGEDGEETAAPAAEEEEGAVDDAANKEVEERESVGRNTAAGDTFDQFEGDDEGNAGDELVSKEIEEEGGAEDEEAIKEVEERESVGEYSAAGRSSGVVVADGA